MNMELITIICSFTAVILFILITWSVAKDYVKINQETNRLTEKTINHITDLKIDTLDSILSIIIIVSIFIELFYIKILFSFILSWFKY